jgi:mRNA interferase MazF
VKRGEIWSVAAGSGYAGKPRPVVIVQDDRFDATASVTVCAFTTALVDAPLLRIPVEPNPTNGLRLPFHLMIDKLTTIPKSKVGSRIGSIDPEDLVRLNQALIVFLGLTGRRATS